MKMKHNKKRNTAFLYECLIKELTKAIVRKEFDKKQQIVEIVKKYFNNGSVLKKELELYNSILESQKMPPEFSQRFLFEVKKDYESMNRTVVFNIQTQLIKEINQKLSNGTFSNFVPNYRNIASIGQFFQSTGMGAKRRLILEQKLVNMLSSEKKQTIQEMKHIDNLTYKTFVKKFNDSYDKTLRKEQKDLLTNYIVSFSDNGLGLKTFLNEEIGRLKQQATECLESDKIKTNTAFVENINKILEKLNGFSKKPITEQVVKDVFYIQDLVSEVLD